MIRTINIPVNVPNHLDVAAIRAQIVRDAEQIVRKAARSNDKRQKAVAVLESNEALDQWIRDNGWTRWQGRVPAAVTRASTYKHVKLDQELYHGSNLDHTDYDLKDAWQGDPRRPVLMRGAKGRLIAIHSASGWGGGRSGSENKWCVEVAMRYVKIHHITSLTVASHRHIFHELGAALRNKYCTSYHFKQTLAKYLHASSLEFEDIDGYGRVVGYNVLINGRQVCVDDHQLKFLKKMYSIIKKFETIDERMKELRRYRQQQFQEAARCLTSPTANCTNVPTHSR